jgi:hypothetical protein
MVSDWNCVTYFYVFFILYSSSAQRLFDHPVETNHAPRVIVTSFQIALWIRYLISSGSRKKQPRWRCLSVFRTSHSHKIKAEVCSYAPHFLLNGLSISLVTSGCYVRSSQDCLSNSDRILKWWGICEMYWESDRNLLTHACAGSLLAAWHQTEVEVMGTVGAEQCCLFFQNVWLCVLTSVPDWYYI